MRLSVDQPGWACSDTVAASLSSVGPVTCECTALEAEAAALVCT